MAPPVLHSISIHYIHSILHSARQNQLDTDRLVAVTGINPVLLHNHQLRITPEQLNNLLHEVWRQSDDEFMGMASQPCRYGVFTLMARQAVHCRTLQQVYRHIGRFYNLTCSSLTLELTEQADSAIFSMRLAAPEKDCHHSLTEFLMLIWHRFPSWLIGQRIPLQQITFDYVEPRHVNEYRLMYPCSPRFEQPVCSLSFDSQWLLQPVVQTPATLRHYLGQTPLDWFRRQAYYPVFTRRVIDLLEQAESPGQLKMAQAADSLYITTRTLRRKLACEGTSFQALKDDVRRDAAIHYLSQPDLPVSQISRLLGFSEPAAFTRAFKQWTGVSPAGYRRY